MKIFKAIIITLAVFVSALTFYTFKELDTLKRENHKLKGTISDLKDDVNENSKSVMGVQDVFDETSDETQVIDVELIPGPQGPQGPQGEPGEIPEGHWERYCIIDKEVLGYDVEGVVMRKANGYCEDGWKTVKIWEK